MSARRKCKNTKKKKSGLNATDLNATDVLGDCRLIDTKQAAQYLDVSEQWLRMSRMRNAPWAGPIPVKLGKRAVRYRLRDLNDFVDQHRVVNYASTVAAA